MPGKNQAARSKLIWPIVWLLGMAAITTWSIVRHLPAIQQEIFTSAQTALDSANIPGITLSVDGRNATLTGNVVNAVVKEQLVNVVADAQGIKSVNDQLTVNIGSASASEPIDKEQITPTKVSALAVNEADEQPRILEEPAEDTGTLNRTPEVNSNDAKIIALANTASVATAPTNSDAADTQASKLQAQLSASILELPALKVQVADGAMTLSGQISNQDSLFELIRTAMTAFNASYVINNVQVDELTAKADWLPAVNRFLPSMQPLSNASIDIVESQIMVSGEASNEDEHDQVIDQALSQLSKLSLVERISINKETEQTPNDTNDTALNAELTTDTVEEPSVKAANINDALDVEESEPTENVVDITNENVGKQIETSNSKNTINIAELIADEASDDTPKETIATDTDEKADAADPESERKALKMAFQSIDTKKLLFQSSRDVLTKDSQAVLANIANLFSQYPQVSIEIGGHTDASGDSGSNLKLSQLRANTVRKFLVDQGISEARLSAYGLGDGVPIADNSTPAGRRLNRRIEFNF